jgi:hypothetical protein
MNLHERKLLAGKAIKQLLIANDHAKWCVWQNLYKTGTRSIKTYKRADIDYFKLQDQITELANMFDLDVKFKFTRGNMWGGPAFIVKL